MSAPCRKRSNIHLSIRFIRPGGHAVDGCSIWGGIVRVTLRWGAMSDYFTRSPFLLSDLTHACTKVEPHRERLPSNRQAAPRPLAWCAAQLDSFAGRSRVLLLRGGLACVDRCLRRSLRHRGEHARDGSRLARGGPRP